MINIDYFYVSWCVLREECLAAVVCVTSGSTFATFSILDTTAHSSSRNTHHVFLNPPNLIAIITRMTIIYHITTQEEWDTAVSQGEYHAESLSDDGFIHCSAKEQILIPANEMYRWQFGLILLKIESDLVTSKLVYEDCYETGMDFPHIYGPLNIDAVQGTIDFPPNDDGSFSLPAGL